MKEVGVGGLLALSLPLPSPPAVTTRSSKDFLHSFGTAPCLKINSPSLLLHYPAGLNVCQWPALLSLET